MSEHIQRIGQVQDLPGTYLDVSGIPCNIIVLPARAPCMMLHSCVAPCHIHNWSMYFLAISAPAIKHCTQDCTSCRWRPYLGCRSKGAESQVADPVRRLANPSDSGWAATLQQLHTVVFCKCIMSTNRCAECEAANLVLNKILEQPCRCWQQFALASCVCSSGMICL